MYNLLYLEISKRFIYRHTKADGADGDEKNINLAFELFWDGVSR